MPIAGRHAALKVTSITATSSTNSAATRSTGVGAANGYVQVNASTRRYLHPDLTQSLYVTAAGSTTLVPAASYTLNPVEGKFEWVTGDPSTGTYTADIKWLTASSVAGGRSWELDMQADMFDVTEFGSSGWKRFMSNMSGATATIERFWNDPSFLDFTVASHRFVVELIINNSQGDKYTGYAYVTSDRPSAAVDQIVGEQINLTMDGPVYYSTA